MASEILMLELGKVTSTLEFCGVALGEEMPKGIGQLAG